MSRLTVTPQGDALLLAGSIDESADLMSLLSRAQGGRLTLDLAGVTFINSLASATGSGSSRPPRSRASRSSCAGSPRC